MDNEEYRSFCNSRLSLVWELIQNLEKDGVPDDSPAFDILAEKAEYWIARLEAVGQVDPATRLVPEVTDLVWN